MTENLNVDRFQNGDIIPEAKTTEEWKAAGNTKRPAWCYYDNDPKNGNNYGKLYNWYAVNDTRGLAPSGWHVPTDYEWTVLSTFLGGEDVAVKTIKSTYGWNDNGNGTNNSGFSGLPGGYRYFYGNFDSVGSNGSWWSASEDDATDAWSRELYDYYSYLLRKNYAKKHGFSVRCVNGPEVVEDKKLVKIETFVQDKPKEVIQTFVDEEAEFPGGYPAMMAWIQKNLVFPETAVENNVQGKCFLRFVVSVDGNISSVTVTKGVPDCPECDKAAIKAIRSMPKWTAGKLNGRSVSSYCSIPINFAIE
jgi:TonB family protein